MIARAWDRVVDAVCRALCVVLWWRFRIIPKAREPEVPLLRQLLVWKSAHLEIYLQHFDNPEDPEWFHCHEWPHMRSFVLSGEFDEERYINLESLRDVIPIEHRRFTTYTMDDDTWHRSMWWHPLCWTLFVCRGGRTVPRGYRQAQLTPDELGVVLGPFIPWRDHIVKRVPSLTGIRTP